MRRDSLKAFLRIGVFIAGAGLCSAFFQPRGSGEFVLSVCSAAMGLALIIGVVVALRYMK